MLGAETNLGQAVAVVEVDAWQSAIKVMWPARGLVAEAAWKEARRIGLRPIASQIARDDTEDAEKVSQASLIHDVFGNPFRCLRLDPSWLTATVVALAAAIYDEQTFDRLPVLGDALEDAGCTNQEILGHCRGFGPHVRGCWVLDLLLGKE